MGTKTSYEVVAVVGDTKYRICVHPRHAIRLCANHAGRAEEAIVNAVVRSMAASAAGGGCARVAARLVRPSLRRHYRRWMKL